MATNIDSLSNITGYKSAATGSTRESKSILDKDSFLKIMVAKLSNQDPLNPTDDTEFIGQLAQITSLEQMVNMNQTTSYSHGLSLVGKTVIAKMNDGYIQGKVLSAVISGGDVTLDVEGVAVPLDNLQVVLSDEMVNNNAGSDDVESDNTNNEELVIGE